MARWPFVSLLVVVACGSEARRVKTVDVPADADGGGAGSEGGPIEPTRPEVTTGPPRGVPHYGAIIATAVTRGGDAALSRDVLGDVRVWPTLDGKVAPRAVPVKNVLAMRVQSGDAGLLAGFAEATGNGHIVRFDRRGERLGVADVTGPGAVQQITPLGDASAVIVLYADQSLALLSPEGVVLSTLSHRSGRFAALEAVGPSAAMVMMRLSEGDGNASHVLARVETAGGKLRFGPEVALPLEPMEPARFAVSPDGKRVAYRRDLDDAKAKSEATRRLDRKAKGPGVAGARAPRPPAVVAVPSRVAVVDATTGADVTPEELHLQTYNDVLALGFSAANRLHVFDQSGVADIDLDAGVVLAGNQTRPNAPAVATGLLLSGLDVALVTEVPGGVVRYLGWQSNVPQRAAPSPDGSRVAWSTMRGELMIEMLDGSKEIYGGLFEAPIYVSGFVGDHRVVIGDGRGSLHVVDADTGKELGSVLPPGPLNQADVDPTTGWVAGIRPGGGVWLMQLSKDGDVTAGEPLQVADGAQQFSLLDAKSPTDPILLTEDPKHVVRRYTAAELTAGITAKQIREQTGVTLPRPMNRYDHTGRGYTFDGRKILVFEGATQRSAIALVADPMDLLVSNDGAVLIVLDRQNAMSRLGPDGAPMWTATMGPGGRWSWALSPDGKRLVSVGGGGGLVLDTATGDRIAASCAWRFGMTAAPPLSRSVGVIPMCQ